MTDIRSLPNPRSHEGDTRRVGIEVECGGVDEHRLARILADALGGTVCRTAEYEWTVEGSRIGDIDVLLDTALRDKVESNIAKAGLAMGRAVIPVEFVTEPIEPDRIAEVDQACAALAEAGAFGTRDGLFVGFGLHLNVALPGTQIDDILPVLTAFALMEDWMRARMDLDPSRRLQPFVETYPSVLVDALCDPEAEWSLDALLRTYLQHAPNRNHALDLLPILKHYQSGAVVEAVPQMAHKSGRPAWHYRLPDCRIGEGDWSVALEWNRWCVVEGVASDPNLLGRLRMCWRDYRGRAFGMPGRWHAVSAEVLDEEVDLP